MTDTPTTVVVGGEPTMQKMFWRYMPGFFFVLVIYLIGRYTINDPRAAIVSFSRFHISWVEILYLIATFTALFEIMKVSHPGINNTVEAIVMMIMAFVQAILLVLGLVEWKGMGPMFANTEFFILFIISVAQTIVAFLINARTLQRNVGVSQM